MHLENSLFFLWWLEMIDIDNWRYFMHFRLKFCMPNEWLSLSGFPPPSRMLQTVSIFSSQCSRKLLEASSYCKTGVWSWYLTLEPITSTAVKVALLVTQSVIQAIPEHKHQGFIVLINKIWTHVSQLYSFYSCQFCQLYARHSYRCFGL